MAYTKTVCVISTFSMNLHNLHLHYKNTIYIKRAKETFLQIILEYLPYFFKKKEGMNVSEKEEG